MIFVDGIVKVRFCGKVVIQLRQSVCCRRNLDLCGLAGFFERYVPVSLAGKYENLE